MPPEPPPSIFVPATGGAPPSAPGGVFVPATGGGTPDAPPGVFVPATGGGSAVAATGTITFSGLPVNNETLTVRGLSYSFKTIASLPGFIGITGTAATMATNTATEINEADGANVTAVAVGAVVTVTANVPGTGGNAYTLAEAATNVTVSGATFTGGSGSAHPSPPAIFDPA